MSGVDNKYDYSYVQETHEKSKAEVTAAIKSFKNGGSVLMALAVILGAIANDMTANMMGKAQELQNESNEKAKHDIANANAAKEPGGKQTFREGNENILTAELQGLTQKLSQFMNAMNNTIKTLGEAQVTVARKG